MDLQSPSINFVGGDELLEKPGGKIVRWALSTGKAVIVLTELIVVVSFISRFKLDSDIADLNEQIKRKQTIITASSEFESRFKSFSARITAVSSTLNTLDPETILVDAKALIPTGVTVSNLSISGSTLSVDGTSGGEQSLAVLSANFKNSPKFTGVTLEKVTKGEGQKNNPNDVDFTFTAQYKKLSAVTDKEVNNGGK